MEKKPSFRWRDSILVLHLRVQPRAKKSGWNGIKEGLIQLRLNALPFENRANQECVCFLAGCFKVPTSKVNIVQWQKARIKSIEIENPNDVQWKKLLNNKFTSS